MIFSVECVYARVSEQTMKATVTTPADRTDRTIFPGASTAWGPFVFREQAEQVVATLAAREDVYSARVIVQETE